MAMKMTTAKSPKYRARCRNSGSSASCPAISMATRRAGYASSQPDPVAQGGAGAAAQTHARAAHVDPPVDLAQDAEHDGAEEPGQERLQRRLAKAAIAPLGRDLRAQQ